MKTECSIVRDLLPLYIEDMVSPETAEFIGGHLKECSECLSELEGMRGGVKVSAEKIAPMTDTEKAKPFKRLMKRMNRRFYMLAYSLIIFFVIMGFGKTAGEDLMYNSLIMPIVGIFGYCVFRWRAVYKLPVLLLLIDLAVFAFGIFDIGFADTVGWTFIYSLFTLVGVAIAFLLHYALSKEERS